MAEVTSVAGGRIDRFPTDPRCVFSLSPEQAQDSRGSKNEKGSNPKHERGVRRQIMGVN
ncbi:MAG: hypothetical protein AAFX86_06870 [Pseudomonadota bacterium]